MKIINHILFVTGIMLIFSTTAFAYLDPSVMTYAIQVVAGLVIAVGAVIGLYWRKAKKKMQDKLGIDENSKKSVEDDVVDFSDDPEKK